MTNGIDGWERGRGWGWIWGDDDEVGALNALTEERRLAALGRVKLGRVYDLGVLIDKRSYLPPVHVGTEVVPYRTPHGLLRDEELDFEEDGVSFNTSMVVLSDHAGTQLDGLCHATYGEDLHWYNGYTYREHGRDTGPERAGGHNIPPVIATAVLIDVPAHMGVDELPASYPISAEDLQGTLSAQDVAIEPGDVVLVRTGALRHWGDVGQDHDRIEPPNTAGLTLEAARWLVEEAGSILVGADNATVEVVPSVDGNNVSPVHKYLLVDQGVHMGELHYLEDLAADAVHRFTYVALSPKVRGTTAGFALRPIALV